MKIGADSWLPPSQRMLDTLKSIDSFGFYGGYLNHWHLRDWDLLRANSIRPLPIWIPDWSKTVKENAQKAMIQSVDNYMLKAIALDLTQPHNYQINSMVECVSIWCQLLLKENWYPIQLSTPDFPACGFVWSAQWGEHDEIPHSGSAIQYGPYRLFGREIVADIADDNFPLAEFVA